MDVKPFFSSPKTSSLTPLSLCFSYPSTSFLQNTRRSLKTHFSLSIKFAEKTSFWGQNLVLDQKKLGFRNLRKTPHFQPITAVPKRRKETPFDNVIQRDKKLRLVLKIRKLLMNQPDRTMALRELGKYRRDLGICVAGKKKEHLIMKGRPR